MLKQRFFHSSELDALTVGWAGNIAAVNPAHCATKYWRMIWTRWRSWADIGVTPRWKHLASLVACWSVAVPAVPSNGYYVSGTNGNNTPPPMPGQMTSTKWKLSALYHTIASCDLPSFATSIGANVEEGWWRAKRARPARTALEEIAPALGRPLHRTAAITWSSSYENVNAGDPRFECAGDSRFECAGGLYIECAGDSGSWVRKWAGFVSPRKPWRTVPAKRWQFGKWSTKD